MNEAHYKKYTIFQENNRLTNQPMELTDAKVCQLKAQGAVVIDDDVTGSHRIYMHPTQEYPTLGIRKL